MRLLPLLALLASAPLAAQNITVYSAGRVAIGTTKQLTAYVPLSPNTVTWSVNNIAGGNTTIGTITATGLYRAPAQVPVANVVTVKATSTAYPARFGSVLLTIEKPTPWVWGVSPNPVLTGPFSLRVTGSGYVPGAVVTFGGIALATQYVSATELRATGTATSAQVGQIAVRAVNPNPGGVTSAPKMVTVQAAATPPPVTVTVSPATATVVAITVGAATTW